MPEYFFIPFLADVDDLVGLIVVVIFVGISLVSNLIKAMSEKQKKEQSAQGSIEKPPVPSQKHVSPAGAAGRVHRLPYAKAAAAGPEPRPRNALEKLEELKQKRLEQIRQQQIQHPQQTPSLPRQVTPPVSRPSYKPPFQPGPVRPAPVKPAEKPIKKAVSIPVAQPVPSAEIPAHQPTIKTGKSSVLDSSLQRFHRTLIAMLRDKKMIQHAIVASEILGKPKSLR
jgi:hypothetical protein